MRLVTYSLSDTIQRAGAFVNSDSDIIDLSAAHTALYKEPNHALTNVLSIIEGGDNALDAVSETIKNAPSDTLLPRKSVTLHAPIQPPPQMRDCSCFELHLTQVFAAARKYTAHALREKPEAAKAALENTVDEDKMLATFNRRPIYYKCNRFAANGADQDVIWPSYSRMMDFELEWGCFIKGTVKDISAENAKDAIFGYTIFNDFTARDEQARDSGSGLGPAKGKDFDTANPMGPCLVTADEISDPYNLEMIARVNGEEWGRGNTGDMRWKFEDVIAHISRSETLHPGEFLGSGTVGNGCGFEHMRQLNPGDIVELEIDKLGTLRNRLVKP